MAEKYTVEQMIAAIREANGILTIAARKLDCSRSTVYNYIERYKSIKAAYEEANESNIDFVETMLMENIKNGNVAAQIFFLKTKAKHRGFVERTETDITSGGEKLQQPQIIEIVKHYEHDKESSE
jgi:hypothetical protein